MTSTVPLLSINNPTDLRPLTHFKLIVFDMDSTLINIECIDEIAAHIGKKTEVAAITAAAMRGEISDFAASLRQRVALLKNTPTNALAAVWQQRLQLNPGAAELVKQCRRAGLKSMLLSGGFLYFAAKVAEVLGIDFIRANELEQRDGVLTGRLQPQSWGLICDGKQKRQALLQMASFLNISPAQTIAVGDGSNDIPMLQQAGLSVAYCAKATVKKHASIICDNPNLTAWLELLPQN